MPARLSVNINDETAAALKEIAEARDITVTEVVRRAISVYKFVEDETRAGKQLQVNDASKNETTTLALF